LANGAADQLKDNNGGGGAGGSILVAMTSITGKGQILANGADAAAFGGAGSGGRIKIYYFQWFDMLAYPLNHENETFPDTYSIGGQGNMNVPRAENGSVWSTPCAPGYEGFFCKKCKVGYYKTEFSNVRCKHCENMPPEAIGDYRNSGESVPMCNYTCNDGIPNV
jgi:hypothetical protein